MIFDYLSLFAITCFTFNDYNSSTLNTATLVIRLCS